MRLLPGAAVLLTAGVGLADKPGHFEHAELRCQRYMTQPSGGGANVLTVVVKWTTADGEIDASEWADLADKLKAPAAKKEGSPNMHRMRVFRQLGTDGWEVVDESATRWTFRRLVP